MILFRSTKPGSVRPSRVSSCVVGAHAAHGDEADGFLLVFIFLITSNKVRIPPVMRLTTGTAKTRCAFGKCAMITQQIGMVMAPRMNAPDAMLAS